MSGSSDRIYLAVKYEERDQVKALGARWDREAKSWYVPVEQNSAAFDRWRPNAASADRDVRDQFAEQLRRAGFRIDGQHPIMDGKIHRAPVDGDKAHERNGSYCGFLDGKPNGWLQNFKSMEKPQKWRSGQQLSAAEMADLAAVSATNRRSAEEARRREAEIASQKAIEILAAASPATSHAYLTEKQVRSHGLFIASPGTLIETENGREIDITGRLLVPIRNSTGNLVSLQIIDDQGGKMFLRGGKVAGGEHVIGEANSPWPLLIAEGYATAATVHQATGHAVAVAFNAHNLGLAAAQHRAQAPDRSIFIAGDNDHHLARNVGSDAAIAAANAIGGTALIPQKAGDRGTDWNDAMKARGMDAIRAELAVGIARATKAKIAKRIEVARCCRKSAARTCARGGRTVKALMIVPMMIAGLAVIVGIFALRVLGLVAAIAGGFGLLAVFGAYAAYSHAPTAEHWLALQQSGSFAAGCVTVVIAAWFGPMWLLQEQSPTR